MSNKELMTVTFFTNNEKTIVNIDLHPFVFSAQATVHWYFIVGPLLAVTVLAFIVLYLWKRRSAGTYTTSNKYICIFSTRSQWKTPNIYYSDYKKPYNYILLTVPILKFEIRVLPFDIKEDYFFTPSKFMKINIIKCNQEIWIAGAAWKPKRIDKCMNIDNDLMLLCRTCLPAALLIIHGPTYHPVVFVVEAPSWLK